MKVQVRQLLIDNSALLAEVRRLEKVIEGYVAINNYLDPEGHAQEEEEFVVLLKKHGFYGEEEE